VPSVDTAWLGPALEIEDLTVTLQVHQTYEPSWRFISDDQSAVDFATRNGLQAIDTPEVLAECYDDGEIGCPQAYDLIIAMREAGRGVRLPPDHWYVCPPLPCP
jgi:hypothetical protein